MPGHFRLTLAQMNPTAGAIGDNATVARAAWREGRDARSDLVALPEMFLTGYPIHDLAKKPAFIRDAMAAVDQLARDCADGPALAIGGPWIADGKLYNAYLIIKGGAVVARILKHHLDPSDAFDERRYFDVGPISGPVRLGPIRIGVPIGEDSRHPDVAEALQESAAQILLVPNASTYHRDQPDLRINHMVARVVETGLPLIYLNMIGGQDGQVFDGGSFGLNAGGVLAVQLPIFETNISHLDLEETASGWRILEGARPLRPAGIEQDYHAIVLGLRDHLAKSGVRKALLHMSGDVESALLATIAADAIGPENLRCVTFSSELPSETGLSDAATVAASLGCRLEELSLGSARKAVTETLAPIFAGLGVDPSEEVMDVRLRDLLLTMLSEQLDERLLISRGGTATGFDPIRDLLTTSVLETCRWRNANHRAWMIGRAGAIVPAQLIDRSAPADNRKSSRKLSPD